MKTIKKLSILILLLVVNIVNAQEEIKPFTKKRMKWIDKDKNKAISFQEMKTYFSSKKNKKGEPIKYGRMFLALDTNNDDKITIEELNQKPDWKSCRTKINKMSSEERAKYDIKM